jgi:primase-polymerase (primpol)-like protein
MDMHVSEQMSAVTLETLATEPVWVAWQLQPDGKRPPKKMPYSPCMAGPAKANDPRTWGTREQAEETSCPYPA